MSNARESIEALWDRSVPVGPLLDAVEAAARAAALLEGADAINEETARQRADGVLGPTEFRPCRDAAEELRALAAAGPQPCGCPDREPCPADCAHWAAGHPDTALRDQIRAAVHGSGKTQVQIAEALGVSQKHLSQMLTGRAVLTLEWAERIAAACGHRVTVAVTAPAPQPETAPEALCGIKGPHGPHAGRSGWNVTAAGPHACRPATAPDAEPGTPQVGDALDTCPGYDPGPLGALCRNCGDSRSWHRAAGKSDAEPGTPGGVERDYTATVTAARHRTGMSELHERIRAIHREVDGSPHSEGSCIEDGQNYPCATLRALAQHDGQDLGDRRRQFLRDAITKHGPGHQWRTGDVVSLFDAATDLGPICRNTARYMLHAAERDGLLRRVDAPSDRYWITRQDGDET